MREHGFLSSPNRPNASNEPAVFQRSSTCHAPKGAAARCCSLRLLAGPGGAALCRRSVSFRGVPVMRRFLACLAALALLLLWAGPASAGFVTLDPPGSVTSQATAISGGNVV